MDFRLNKYSDVWYGILALLMAISSIALAQNDTAKAGTPEEVMRQFFEAMKAGDAAKVASLMDPGILSDFSAGMIKIIKATDTTIRDKQWGGLFALAGTMDKFLAMDSLRMFETFLKFSFEEGKGTEIFAKISYKILGHVMEGQDKAHVLFRIYLNPEKDSSSALDIFSVSKRGSEWKALYRGDITGAMSMAGGEQ